MSCKECDELMKTFLFVFHLDLFGCCITLKLEKDLTWFIFCMIKKRVYRQKPILIYLYYCTSQIIKWVRKSFLCIY